MHQKKGILKKMVLSIIAFVFLFILVLFVNYQLFEKNWSAVSQGQPIPDYGERRAALLVIDIQEGTTGAVSKNSFYKKNADIVIEKVNLLSDLFEKSGDVVIYIRTEVSNPLINLLDNSYAKGSAGASFDKRLQSHAGLEVIKYGNDSFIQSHLDSILVANKINDLYIAGLDAAYCIHATSDAARNRNYSVYLIEDAILSESEKMKDSMMVDFRNRGMEVSSTDRIKQ